MFRTITAELYRKMSKNSDTRKKCRNYRKIGTVSFYYSVISKDLDGMANRVDPDQNAPVLHCLPRPVCPKT